jgi:hypothetical protein
MPRKGRSNEEIIHPLQQVEGGEKVAEVCRRLGRQRADVLPVEEAVQRAGAARAPRVASRRHENAKLKQLVSGRPNRFQNERTPFRRDAQDHHAPRLCWDFMRCLSNLNLDDIRVWTAPLHYAV